MVRRGENLLNKAEKGMIVGFDHHKNSVEFIAKWWIEGYKETDLFLVTEDNDYETNLDGDQCIEISQLDGEPVKIVRGSGNSGIYLSGYFRFVRRKGEVWVEEWQ